MFHTDNTPVCIYNNQVLHTEYRCTEKLPFKMSK